MQRTKPLGKHEIDERALLIACDLFAAAEIELKPGEGPATAQKIRRFLRGRARRELLRERRAKWI